MPQGRKLAQAPPCLLSRTHRTEAPASSPIRTALPPVALRWSGSAQAGLHLVLRKADGDGAWVGSGEKAPSREATLGEESGGWFRLVHAHLTPGGSPQPSGEIQNSPGRRASRPQSAAAHGARADGQRGAGHLRPQPVLHTRPLSPHCGENDQHKSQPDHRCHDSSGRPPRPLPVWAPPCTLSSGKCTEGTERCSDARTGTALRTHRTSRHGAG